MNRIIGNLVIVLGLISGCGHVDANLNKPLTGHAKVIRRTSNTLDLKIKNYSLLFGDKVIEYKLCDGAAKLFASHWVIEFSFGYNSVEKCFTINQVLIGNIV